MNNAMLSTGLPENFNVFTPAELDHAVAVVRSCPKGERVLVFGVECVCVRRGWFQIVGGVKHEVRSVGIVRLIANMPSLRQAALIRSAQEATVSMGWS